MAGKGYQGKTHSCSHQPSIQYSGDQIAGDGAIGSILGWVTNQMQASEDFRQKSEMQDALATRVQQMIGIDLKNFEKDKEKKQRKEGKDSGGYVQGGLKAVRKLLGPDDDSSLSGDSSSSSKKMKKKKLAKKEKKSSGSRDRPKSDSSDSEPDWLTCIRKEVKEKRSRRDKGEASGLTSGPRMLPEEDVIPAEEDQKSTLVWEQKVQIRKKLNIGDKVADEQLKAEEWEAYVSAAARKQDLMILARTCQVNGHGSKIEILARIVDWYKGGN